MNFLKNLFFTILFKNSKYFDRIALEQTENIFLNSAKAFSLSFKKNWQSSVEKYQNNTFKKIKRIPFWSITRSIMRNHNLGYQNIFKLFSLVTTEIMWLNLQVYVCFKNFSFRYIFNLVLNSKYNSTDLFSTLYIFLIGQQL